MRALPKPWSTAALALACTTFSFGVQEEEKPRDPLPPAAAPHEVAASPSSSLHAGVRMSLWLGKFEFEARTAVEEVELDEAAVPAAEIYGILDLDESWSIELGLEALLVTHANALNVALSGRYKFELLGEGWSTHAKAGLIAGTMDLDDAPGDFDPGIGVQGGLSATYALSPSLSLNLEVKLRYLEYEFDEDSDFLETDGSIGGFSVGLSAGLELRF